MSKLDEKISSRLKQFRLFLNLDQAKFADMIGIHQQQLSKYERGLNEPSTKFYVKLCELTDINLQWLLSGLGEMTRSKSTNVNNNGMYFIPYLEAKPEVVEKIKKPGIDKGIFVGLDVITNEWGCKPENVRIVSTPGEEMDGGQYPIRNNDILVIDISNTNVGDSGVFLVSTNNDEVIALRRLVESLQNSIAFYVDNEKYAPLINRIMSKEDLEAMDFKVIGRVVKNVTYTL